MFNLGMIGYGDLMRILVVDPDESAVDSLTKQLKTDGHDVVYAGKPALLWAQFRIRPPDVVVLDLSRRRMNGFDLAKEIRKERGAELLEIVLTSPKHAEGDSEVINLMKTVSARFFYPKPLNVGQVIEDLAKPRPRVTTAIQPANRAAKPAPNRKRKPPAMKAQRAPKVVPAAPEAVDWDNARTLVELWANRRSGHLVLAGQGVSGTAVLQDGGLVEPAGFHVVEHAVKGGVVAFRESAVEGVGDWAGTGAQIFGTALKGCSAATIRRYLHTVPAATDFTDLARTLPLSKAAKALIGGINGQLDLEEICARKQVTPGDISRELETLVKLELVLLRHPKNNEEQITQGSDPGIGIELGNEDEQRLRNARESEDLNDAAAMGVQHIAAANRVETPEHLRKRLSRELSTIMDSPASVVLGIPGDAAVQMVDEAAARMRRRYTRMMADPTLPADIAQLAKEITGIIDRAHRNFDFSGALQTGQADAAPQHGYQDEVVRLLEEGRELIAQGAWEDVDRTLTKAHAEQLDHAEVLANLGWARLHNPSRTPEERAEEGRDFLLLAEQFDPNYAQGQYFLAQVFLAGGQLDAAEVRARRAKEIEPNEASFAALHRKVQVKIEMSQA